MNPKEKKNFLTMSVGVLAILLTGILFLFIINKNRIKIQRIPFKQTGNNTFLSTMDSLLQVDTSLINYVEITPIDIFVDKPKALCVDNQDRVYVAGSFGVNRINPSGKSETVVKLDNPIHCIFVNEYNSLVVCSKNTVYRFNESGNLQVSWSIFEKNAYITSVTTTNGTVFVADAGMKLVWCFDSTGNLIRRIGEKDTSRNIPGFFIPNPYMDITTGQDGSIWVVNSGRHLIENYRLNGDIISSWGKYGVTNDGFCGCCNPVYIALLPDGSFVTSEKGITRIKIYSPAGEFLSVVAAPSKFHSKITGLDVAVNSSGNILVLDTYEKRIRIFQKKD